MKVLTSILLGLIFINNANTTICDRDPYLRRAIEQKIEKLCKDITSNDLKSATRLEYRTSYAFSKYLFASEGSEWDLRGANKFSGLINLEYLKITLQSDFSPVILKSA